MNWAKREAGPTPWESTLNQAAVDDTRGKAGRACQVVIIRWSSSYLYNH